MADTPLCDLDQQIVAAHLPPPAPKSHTVLDFGCGTGRLAIPLASAGYQVVGIDLSHRMLQRMLAKGSQNASGKSLGRPAFASPAAVQANLVELDCLASDAADHAICMFSTLGMIQGRQNRIQFLRHACRVVRCGGTFIVHVHRRWAGLRESGGCRRLLRSWLASVRHRDHEFGDAFYAYRGLRDMFMHRFTRTEITAELEAAGWAVERFEWADLRGHGLTDSAWNASGMFVICRAT